MTPIMKGLLITLVAILVGLIYGLALLAFGPEPSLQETGHGKPEPRRLKRQQVMQILVLGLIFLFFLLIWRVTL